MKIESRLLYTLPLVILFSLLTLSGCAAYRDLPAGTVKGIGSSVVARESVSVPVLAPEPAPGRDYLIGPGDVLLVNVAGKPEFTVPVSGGTGKVLGSRVDGSGALHLPLVGTVPVAGLTLTETERKLTGLLKRYLQDPSVVTEIIEYKSQPLYLLGQFRVSGTYYLDRPLTLVQGVALGNGFDSTANLKGARLTRDGKIVPVDLYDLLLHGDASQNVWLKGGDTLYIPENKNQQIFIFGAVKKPG
ncbi:MAG TPA: polysaccharide biosynthesis/export family protein, partial [Geomonas sp.]